MYIHIYRNVVRVVQVCISSLTSVVNMACGVFFGIRCAAATLRKIVHVFVDEEAASKLDLVALAAPPWLFGGDALGVDSQNPSQAAFRKDESGVKKKLLSSRWTGSVQNGKLWCVEEGLCFLGKTQRGSYWWALMAACVGVSDQ